MQILRDPIAELRLGRVLNTIGADRSQPLRRSCRSGRSPGAISPAVEDKVFLLSLPSWLHGIIAPPPGYGMALLDWKAQEIGICRRTERRPGADRGLSGRRPSHGIRDPRRPGSARAPPRTAMAISATWSSRSRSAANTACRSTGPRLKPANHWHGRKPHWPSIGIPIRCSSSGNRTSPRRRCSTNASPACSAGRWRCTQEPRRARC